MPEGYLGPACKRHGPHCGHSDNDCPDNPQRAEIDAEKKQKNLEVIQKNAPELGVALKYAAMMQGWSELADEAWKKDPDSKFSQLVKKWRDTVNTDKIYRSGLNGPSGAQQGFPTHGERSDGLQWGAKTDGVAAFMRGAERQWSKRRPDGLLDAAVAELGLEEVKRKFGGTKELLEAFGLAEIGSQSSDSRGGYYVSKFDLTKSESELIKSFEDEVHKEWEDKRKAA